MPNRMSRMCPNKLYGYKYTYQDVMPIGKYKGEKVGTVLEKDASYIVWISKKKLMSFTHGILSIAGKKVLEQQIKYSEKFAPWGEEDAYWTEDMYGRND